MRAFARRPFTYNGIILQQGEVFELIGAKNDEKLLSMGHCDRVSKKTEVLDCTCGKSYVGEGCYRNHQRSPVHPKEPILVASS